MSNEKYPIPWYPLPWKAEDNVVLDGNGEVVTVCLTPAIANVIAHNYNLNPIVIFEEENEER